MSTLPFDPRPRRAAFRALHEDGCFVLPNPWDVGSARYLHGLGFAALASTSSGVAWSRASRTASSHWMRRWPTCATWPLPRRCR